MKQQDKEQGQLAPQLTQEPQNKEVQQQEPQAPIASPDNGAKISYDEFKKALSDSEKRFLENLERASLFSKLRGYFSGNTPIIETSGVEPVCVNVIKLRYVGEEKFYIRTRNQGFEVSKGDVVVLPLSAYGKAYERMSVFEKL